MVMFSKKLSRVLSDFDVEIVERHHNQKIDAPSDTAIMLVEVIKEIRRGLNSSTAESKKWEKRDKNEIGIHFIRAGNLVGEHRVIFGGKDEEPRRQSELLTYSSSAIRAKIEGGVDVTSAFRTVVSAAEYLVKPCGIQVGPFFSSSAYSLSTEKIAEQHRNFTKYLLFH